MERQLNDIFPVFEVEQDTILTKTGELSIVFRMALPQVFTNANEDYETMHQYLVRAVRQLEPGTTLHKQDYFYKGRYQAPATMNASWLDRSAARYFEGKPMLNHECYLTLTRQLKRRDPVASGTSSLLAKNIVPKELLAEETMLAFEAMVARFKKVLESCKLISLTRLKNEDLLSRPKQPGLIERFCSLNSSRAYGDIVFDKGLCVGGKQLAIYALSDPTNLPAACGSRIDYDAYSTDTSRFPISFAAHLGLLLPVDHIYNQYLTIGDAQQTLKELERKRLRLQSLATYSRANTVALEATNQFLNEAVSQQRLPIKAHFNVMIWADSAEVLRPARNQVTNAFTSIDASVKEETIGAPQLWWAAIPGNAGQLPVEDSFDIFAEQACCFLNLETNYRAGDPQKGIRFCDRLNHTPVYMDLFEGPRNAGITSNMGTLICGTSGGGKSMTSNHMLRTLYDQGAHCVVVDIGGSYKSLCKNLKGYYFSYTREKPISFNPFYLAAQELGDSEKMEGLKSLLVALWKRDDEHFKRSEYVSLSTALHGYFQQLEKYNQIFPCFDSFYEYLDQQYDAVLKSHRAKDSDFDLDSFLYVLRPFYKDGEFSYLLNAREQLDLPDQRFVVMELDHVKDHPVIFPVVALMITNMFVAKLRKLKGIRKVLCIDEAWKAIAKASMAEFIRYAFKTIRKEEGIPMVITQELDDLVSSPIIKEAIINNTDVKILMDVKKLAHKLGPLQAALGLSEKARTILLSTSKEEREIFIDLGGQVQQVFCNLLCPQEYYTFTTDGKERVEVEKYIEEYGDAEKGIEALIKHKSL